MNVFDFFTGKITSYLKLSLLIVLALFIGLTGCGKESLSDIEHVERAKNYLEQDSVNAAVIELKNALQQNPENAEARLLLGQIYVDVGDGPSAEKELRRARDLGIGQEIIMVPFSKALLLQDKHDEIINIMVADDLLPASTRASLHTVRGRAFLARDNLDKATEEFRLALEADKDSVDAWFGQALLAYRKQDFNESLSWLDKVLKAGPSFPEAYALRGDIAIAQLDYEKAEEAYRQVIDALPQQLAYRIALANAQINLDKLDEAISNLNLVLKQIPNHVHSNYLRAVAAYQKQDFEQAKLYAEKVLAIQPNHLASRLIAGHAAYTLNQLQQANNHLEKFVAQVPAYDPALKLLAATQARLGSIKEATVTLEPVAGQSVDDAKLFTAIGQVALQSGDLRASRALFEKAVGIQPDDAQAKLQLGLTKVALDEQEGVADLQHALELDPKLEAAEILIILSLLREGSYDEALIAAKRLQENQPNNPHGFTLAGIAHVAKDEEAKARAAFAKALEIEPGEPNASNNLAALELRDGERNEARKLYEDVLAHNPGHFKTLLDLANLEIQDKQFPQAIAWLEKAVEINPDAVDPRISLGKLYFTEGKPREVLATTKPILKQQANNPELLEVVGRAQLQVGEFDDAVATLRDWVQAKPETAEPHFYLAIAYERQGDFTSASQHLEKALQRNPEHVPSKFALARFLAASGHFEDAQELLNELKAAYPESSLIPELEGKISMLQAHPQEAIPFFRKALERRANSSLIIQLAAAQWQVGEREASHATLKEWLDKYPQDSAVRIALAGSFLSLDRLEEASIHYAEIMRYDSDNVIALNNLAWISLRLGDVDDALSYAERAYELAPANAQVMDTLGVILLAKGRTDNALKIFEKAVERSPTDMTIQFHQAQALVQYGEIEKAQMILEKLLAEGQSFKSRDEAQILLKNLQN